MYGLLVVAILKISLKLQLSLFGDRLHPEQLSTQSTFEGCEEISSIQFAMKVTTIHIYWYNRSVYNIPSVNCMQQVSISIVRDTDFTRHTILLLELTLLAMLSGSMGGTYQFKQELAQLIMHELQTRFIGVATLQCCSIQAIYI